MKLAVPAGQHATVGSRVEPARAPVACHDTLSGMAECNIQTERRSFDIYLLERQGRTRREPGSTDYIVAIGCDRTASRDCEFWTSADQL